eukprot:m.309777 g.309777  ORF g.309777 m.309777 type:complete len:419 (+) comp47739_c0_seq1:94-1350(+)
MADKDTPNPTEPTPTESAESPTKATAALPAPNPASATDLNASAASTYAAIAGTTTSAITPTNAQATDAAVAANSHRVKELRLHFPSGEQLVEIEETGPHDDDEVYQRLIDAASASSLAQGQRVKRFLLPLTPKQISILPNGAIIVPEFEVAATAGAGPVRDSFYSPVQNPDVDALADVNAGLPSDIKTAVASSEEIDTKTVAARVQELLASHHISQAAFSENIVKLTQGALSNLLNKPKPWSTLHSSGRQPYLRMKLWLEEEGFHKRLAALVKLQHERRGRKRPFTPSVGGLSAGDGSTPSPAKRMRHVLTDVQKSGLQELYAQNTRPSKDELVSRAEHLGLPISTVTNWFHNQRAKANRMKMDTSQSEMEPEKGEESQTSNKDDPVKASSTEAETEAEAEEPAIVAEPAEAVDANLN